MDGKGKILSANSAWAGTVAWTAVSGSTTGRWQPAMEGLSVPGSLNRSGAWTSKAKIGKTAREKRIYSHSRDLNASRELIGYVDQKNQVHLWVLI